MVNRNTRTSVRASTLSGITKLAIKDKIFWKRAQPHFAVGAYYYSERRGRGSNANTRITYYGAHMKPPPIVYVEMAIIDDKKISSLWLIVQKSQKRLTRF